MARARVEVSSEGEEGARRREQQMRHSGESSKGPCSERDESEKAARSVETTHWIAGNVKDDAEQAI